MTFLQKIQDEWKCEVQPILDDICKGVHHIINGKEGFDIFKQYNLVDLYTKIYNMTTSFQFDFTHLDFLYHQEMDVVISFCKQFDSIHSLEEMNRHVQGFNLLIRWFYCFFHHLNRLREKVYPNIYGVEEDMKHIVKNHYLQTHKHTISQLICGHWADIRSSGGYPTDNVLLETIKIIADFDREQHEYLIYLYYDVLQKYSRQLSSKWLSEDNILTFMNMTHQLLLQEKQMFLYYFHQHYEKMSHICSIVKNIFIDPHFDMFLTNATHGWKAILHSNRIADLKVAYHFYSWCNDHTEWLSLYQEFLKEKIQSFQKDQLILCMVRLLKEQTDMLEVVFVHEKTRGYFRDMLNRVFQKKMIQDNQMVVQLVKTIHMTISKKSSDLSDLVVLAGYCSDKELFYEYYHLHLRKRLLSGRFNPIRERGVLTLLKERFGSSFTLNLFLMLGEMCNECLSDGSYHMYRLSGVVWGINNNKTLQYRLPTMVEKKMQLLYNKWRKKTNTAIRLEPSWSHGSVVLSMGSSEFIMNPIQAIVLLALETPLSRQELVGVLGVPDDEEHNVDGVLESLSKSLLIEKCSNHDHWRWILSHKPDRIVIPPVRKNKTLEKEMGLSPVVVEAFIVKIMKKEKQLSFLDLMVHLVEQYPDIHNQVSWVRKLVENLVDREFISRGENLLFYVP